jgi:hypothetical protein
MSYSIITPRFSFVRFDGSELTGESCNFADINFALPVFAVDDLAWQFVISTDEVDDTELCSASATPLQMGIVLDCGDAGLLYEFTGVPQRFLVATGQVLFNWTHGVQGLYDNVEIGECFYVKIIFEGNEWCSNKMQRIGDDCHTTVLEYGADENAFGFAYCAGELVGDATDPCEPLFVTFNNKSTLTLPWTASLANRYGDAPSIQTWIYDSDGLLTRMLIREAMDAYPPTYLTFDFGGPASGVIRISG